MKLMIKDELTLKSLQDAFSTEFPFLKIEFFSKLHQPGTASGLKFKLYNTKTIGECRDLHTEGELEVTPEMTVVEFEQTMGEIYGLGVQVFRKTINNNWIETINTDGWTLKEHNVEPTT
ncbi:MAG: hypothetical protein V4604_07350 [Bacteroidota bacterium]